MSEDRDRLRRQVEALEDRRPELLQRLARELRELVHADLMQKAAGGRGADGKTWKRLATSTRRRRLRKHGSALIGIVDGSLLGMAALQIGTDAAGCTVTNVDPAARYFDPRRKLLPDTMPPAWLERLDEVAQTWLDAQT